MKDSTKFRKYAEECRQLSKHMRPEHQATLLEIADAWDQCAQEAEAGEGKRKKQRDSSAGAAMSMNGK
jgi:hypothetical protein